MDILFLLILGHIFGDYAFQTDSMATHKKHSLTVLSFHVFAYVGCIWLTFFLYSVIYHPGLFLKLATLLFLGALFIQHWIQDYFKSRFNNGSKQLYYLDQAMHLAVLYIYRIFIFN